MRSILEAQDLKGKRVLVRVDWNVPFKDGKVADDFRIKASLPTIEYLENAGAKVIIASHLEPAGASLASMSDYVSSDVEILKNLRNNLGEAANSPGFAAELAGLADVYVNEAFSVSHRKHASIVGVPKLLPSFAGLRFVEEVKELSQVFKPPHPFLFIIGGAKSDTKIPLIEKFLDIADEVFIGGTLAVEAAKMSLAKNSKVSFPIGDIVALDVNEETITLLQKKIKDSKFILWNGPLGKYEDGFKKGTLSLAKIIVESEAKSIVGGGDTLAAIHELNLLDKFSFASTGGGAMLQFLATGTLPGIVALEEK